MPRYRFVPLVALLILAGCSGSNPSPTPAPPSGGGGESITGRERIGWDQAADSTAQLATFRYAIYVDNVRSELADVTCSNTLGANGYACSARLPTMSNGTHILEIAVFINQQGIVESPKSSQFRVTVTGVGTGAVGPLASGDVVTTKDGVRLRASVLYEGLRDATSLVIAADGRAFVATADGLLILKDGALAGPPQLTDGTVLSLDLSPDFAHDGYLFVTQAIAGVAGEKVFRTSRVRDMGGWVADRMVILEHGPASVNPAAAVRFGPDGKLHLAFDDGGDVGAAEQMSEWRGKLLRMEPDGRTPRDQAAATPVLWRGLTSPRGFDWSLDGSALWIADASRDGVERLRLIAATASQPRRVAQRASYVLPAGLGASGAAVYRGTAIDAFTGDLFVSGRDGGYILRIQFEAADAMRPLTTEPLLEGVAGSVRALTVAPDGAIYFVSDTRLLRLAR